MAGQEVDRSKNDFSKGPVWKCIVMQAVPLTIAQLVQLLYNDIATSTLYRLYRTEG